MKHFHPTLVAVGCLIVAALVAALAPGQDADADRELRERWQQAYKNIAASIEMRRGDVELKLHDTPLLFYTNPVRQNDQHGTIFLWTEQGRPAIFGSIWSAINRTDPSSRNVTHEFHALADRGSVRASRDGLVLWDSGEAGIAWQTLPGLPAPAASRPARLTQMRAIARRLSGRITAEETSELRLMTNPLYRYPEGVPGALDGALFVYAMATDPELILLVDAGDSDKPGYKIAFARFGNLSMEARDGERTIWTCDRGTPGRSEGKYYLRWRAEQMPREPAEVVSR